MGVLSDIRKSFKVAVAEASAVSAAAKNFPEFYFEEYCPDRTPGPQKAFQLSANLRNIAIRGKV